MAVLITYVFQTLDGCVPRLLIPVATISPVAHILAANYHRVHDARFSLVRNLSSLPLVPL
jgi:hypothetical protein